MKWYILIITYVLTAISAFAGEDALHQEIRRIRRLYLDLTGLVPSPEEMDWYLVYNRHGYELALDHFIQAGQIKASERARYLESSYVDAPDQALSTEALERNVIYLAGLWKGVFSRDLYERAEDRFIRDALLVAEDKPDDAIEYMVNGLTCRPSTAREANELSELYRRVSLKSDDKAAWRTVVLHIFQLHDCKYR